MKILRKITVAIAACLCILGCLIGCASQVRKVTATAKSYCGDPVNEKSDSLEIKVNFESAHASPGGTRFYSENTLSELKEQIDNQKQKDYTLQTKEYGENYLLIEKTKDGYGYRYLLVRYEQTSGNGWSYGLMGLSDVPYHLFGDAAYEEFAPEGFLKFQTAHAYPSENGIDVFYDYYQSIETGTATKEANVITYRSIAGTLKITFDETENGTRVTYFYE